MTDPDEAIVRDPNFQAVLRALLDKYRPFLEQQLELASSPEELIDGEKANRPSCEEEIARAKELLSFLTLEEVVERLLPPQAREMLGTAEQWRWCMRLSYYCALFGWLVCRARRTFRAYSYYVEVYWKLVRDAVGNPVHEPPTLEERADLQALVVALSTAYEPYLREELSSAADSRSVANALLGRTVDCNAGSDAQTAIFERLLTPQTTRLLLGRAAVEREGTEPYYWFCGCWCLAAMEFGCCLASSSTLFDVLRCLVGSLMSPSVGSG